MAAVKRNADTTITPACLSSASLQWHHYFTNHFLLFYHSWQQPPPFVFLPSGVQCLLFRRQTLQRKMRKTGRKVTQGEKWGLSLKSETAAAASPLLFISHQSILSPNPSKLFFSPLSDHSLFHLRSLLCLYCRTPAIFWEESDKNETFFQRKNAEHARIG